MQERIDQLEMRITELESVVKALVASNNTATESLETLVNTAAENAANLSKFIGMVAERFSIIEEKIS